VSPFKHSATAPTAQSLTLQIDREGELGNIDFGQSAKVVFLSGGVIALIAGYITRLIVGRPFDSGLAVASFFLGGFGTLIIGFVSALIFLLIFEIFSDDDDIALLLFSVLTTLASGIICGMAVALLYDASTGQVANPLGR